MVQFTTWGDERWKGAGAGRDKRRNPPEQKIAPLIPSSRGKVPPVKYHLGHSTLDTRTLGHTEIWTHVHSDTRTHRNSDTRTQGHSDIGKLNPEHSDTKTLGKL